jgi:hypothetical protein
MPVISMTGKLSKEKSPVGQYPTGLFKMIMKKVF